MSPTAWEGKYPYEFRDADVIERRTFTQHGRQLEVDYLHVLFWTAFDFYVSEGPATQSDRIALLPIYECGADSMGSFLLATLGRYKPALSLLRSTLELSFLAVRLKIAPSDVGKAEKGDLRWHETRDVVLNSPSVLPNTK